ncbi:MAG: APA family basic amino acid/polyamine antiporter [Kiritimatiellia bacterium]|jgi:APA family basic amino acid/polyamine antiporter
MAKKTQTLKKELGLLNVFMIATGTTLSAGFFLLPGIAFESAGPAITLAYMIAAIPLIPAMLSAVELSTAMPRAGGAYYFLDRSLGPMIGTIGGIGTWLALMLKTAFALIGMGAYVQLFFPEIPARPMAFAFAILFGLVNISGSKGAGIFQTIMVTALLIILGIFIGGGSMEINMSHFSNYMGMGSDNILSTAGLVYISYVGVTKVASVSEEIKNPERNLPLGVFMALTVAIVVYALGTFVMVGVIPADQLHHNYTPVATAAEIIFGHWGKVMVTIAAVFAFSSVANAGILSASRYPLAMSRDHLLPPMFRKLSKKGVPVVGIVVTVAAILFILLLDAKKIAKLASAFQLLMFGFLCLAVIVMRESNLDSYDPGYKSPLYPWMQIFGILSAIWLISQMGVWPILFAFGLIIVSLWWYRFYAHGRMSRDGAVFHIFERLGRRRDEGLDGELRGILKEKGLRDADPFDDIVARAHIIEADEDETFESICKEASKWVGGKLGLPPDGIMSGYMEGTRIGATPVAYGAALPHIRLHGMEHPEIVICRVKKGIIIERYDPFGAKEPDELVYAIFFLSSPEEDPGQHLRILAQIAGRIDDDDFMEQWQGAHSEQELKETLLRDERYISLHLREGSAGSELIERPIGELPLPESCLVALIRRQEFTFVPRSDAILKDHDRLTIIGDPAGIKELYARYHPEHL